MSRPSTWAKPRHHAGTEAPDQKNFVGKGGTTPKIEGGQMNRLFDKGSKGLKKYARRRRR